MDETMKYNMCEAMHRYGGGFIRALAECFLAADHRNTIRLMNAFPEYVEQYLKMAQRDLDRSKNESAQEVG